MSSMQMASLQACSIAIVFFLVYLTAIIWYRLSFHPLSSFPGPKLAATTKWYEFYYDILKRPGGTYMFEIERMHDVYGKKIQITCQIS